MALMAAHGEITPMPKCAIFADTQDEPEDVYKWLSYLCGVEVKYRLRNGTMEAYIDAGTYQTGALIYPVVIVTKGSLSKKVLGSYLNKAGRRTTISIPFFMKGGGLSPRQCTSDYKVYPIDREITRQMRDSGAKRCVKWIGISLDEIYRMKPARRSTVEHRWPLVDGRIKRNDCELWMQKNGYPKPPRSACRYCPYHSDSEWRRLRDEQPNDFDKAVNFEREAQLHIGELGWKDRPFLHRSLVPLDQVDFSTDEDHGQQVMFGNECEGMCGV